MRDGWVILAVLGVACVPRERADNDTEAGAGGRGPRFTEASAAARPLAHRAKPPPYEPRRGGSMRRPDVKGGRTGAEERVQVVPPVAPSGVAPKVSSVATSVAAPHGAAEDDAVLTAPFHDDFERLAAGPDFRTSSSAWFVEDGRLCGENAKNHPIWLKRRLPVNARVEFDAQSLSRDGDLKLEVWGDGASSASSVSYSDASSYILIYGGWKNRLHVLARLDEHGPDRLARRVNDQGDDLAARSVSLGTAYHFKVERSDGETLHWYVDDIEIHSLRDPEPLSGAGHDHFAFNDWEARVCFDDLTIVPLED